MHVNLIPCLTDNYAYIINDNVSKKVGVVDPSEASPIITYLKKQNLKLDYILNTHHHYDHIGGNIELKKLYNAKVIGFVGDKHRIPGIDITLEDNVKWIFGKSSVKILHIPGHTLGHICFFFENEKIAFTGDTLFSLGCGRIFEGTFEQMFKSLEKIKSLPKDTRIYCGHEYTDNNGKFCISIDKENEKLKDRIKEVQIKRKRNQPTLPVSLGQELDTNIFLRCDDKKIKNNIKMKTSSELEIFTKLRNLKDKF